MLVVGESQRRCLLQQLQRAQTSAPQERGWQHLRSSRPQSPPLSGCPGHAGGPSGGHTRVAAGIVSRKIPETQVEAGDLRTPSSPYRSGPVGHTTLLCLEPDSFTWFQCTATGEQLPSQPAGERRCDPPPWPGPGGTGGEGRRGQPFPLDFLRQLPLFLKHPDEPS